MQLVIGNTYESSRGFGRLLYLGETHDIDGYLPTFRTTKGDLKFYSYDQLPGALVEFAPPTVSRADELIACLEGEIAKRDAELERLRAKTTTTMGVGSGDGQLFIHGDYESVKAAQGIVIERDQLRAELSALKAQEPVAYIPVDRETGEEWPPVLKKGSGNICDYKPLYAAPVYEAKAQGVVMPERREPSQDNPYLSEADIEWNACLDEIARLNAAPSAPAADAGLVEALEEIVAADWASSETATDFAISQTKGFLISKIKDIARAAIAAHRAKGVV